MDSEKFTFKDAVAADIDTVFFDALEFAEEHSVDGTPMLIVMDENELNDRQAHWEGGTKQSFDQGLYQADMLIYVKKKDYGPKPKVGKQVKLDKVIYRVLACAEDAGVFEMMLQRVKQ